MLVLKGGSTSDWESFDNPWQPIDDFQAPYREPVLPPPDFDPDTLDIGVGVPIETIIEQREREKKIRAKKNHMYDTTANVREIAVELGVYFTVGITYACCLSTSVLEFCLRL